MNAKRWLSDDFLPFFWPSGLADSRKGCGAKNNQRKSRKLMVSCANPNLKGESR
jgi:hypothetical protein